MRSVCAPFRDDWAHKLPLLEFAYNSACHASTKLSPFEVCYGFKPRSAMDVSLSSDVPIDVHDRVVDMQRLQRDVYVAVERSHSL